MPARRTESKGIDRRAEGRVVVAPDEDAGELGAGVEVGEARAQFGVCHELRRSVVANLPVAGTGFRGLEEKQVGGGAPFAAGDRQFEFEESDFLQREREQDERREEEEDDVDSNNKLPPQVNYLILFILNFTDFMPQK
jgi:hypothetical protein